MLKTFFFSPLWSAKEALPTYICANNLQQTQGSEHPLLSQVQRFSEALSLKTESNVKLPTSGLNGLFNFSWSLREVIGWCWIHFWNFHKAYFTFVFSLRFFVFWLLIELKCGGCLFDWMHFLVMFPCDKKHQNYSLDFFQNAAGDQNLENKRKKQQKKQAKLPVTLLVTKIFHLGIRKIIDSRVFWEGNMLVPYQNSTQLKEKHMKQKETTFSTIKSWVNFGRTSFLPGLPKSLLHPDRTTSCWRQKIGRMSHKKHSSKAWWYE